MDGAFALRLVRQRLYLISWACRLQGRIVLLISRCYLET